MDIIPIIHNVTGLVDRLKKVNKNIEEAEFNNILADLSNEVADLKITAAGLKLELAEEKDKNFTLRHQLDMRDNLPEIEEGCYVFGNETGRYYCTACYDTKGRKSLTTRNSTVFRECPVCKAIYSIPFNS